MNQRIQKQNIREKYWRYSLYVILLGLGTVIFVELIPFLGGLLGALTIYVLLRGQMRALTIRHKLRRSLAASLLIGEAIVCFLIPLSLLVWLLVAKLQDVTLDPSTVIQPIRNLAELIRERIGYNLLDGDNIAKLVELLPRAGQWVLQSIGSFAVNVVVLLFVLYFMLIGGREMESYLRKFIPFNRTVTQEFTREVVMIVRSNAIGIPLLAVIQGAVALVGYWLCGVPWALFWGVVTCVATIVPLLGTALVWLPLAAYLGLIGHWGAAVGLLAYGVVVITQVDNLARFVLQKRMADTHPLVTIFGVIIGLSLFGFMGVIFGPVLLQGVALLRHIGENGVDAVCESHVQHFVRFVHNHVLYGGEGHGFAFHQVQQSSRCGYDDVYTPFQGAYLAFDGRASIYGQHSQAIGIFRIIVQVACYLQTKFAGGAENK